MATVSDKTMIDMPSVTLQLQAISPHIQGYCQRKCPVDWQLLSVNRACWSIDTQALVIVLQSRKYCIKHHARCIPMAAIDSTPLEYSYYKWYACTYKNIVNTSAWPTGISDADNRYALGHTPTPSNTPTYKRVLSTQAPGVPAATFNKQSPSIYW